MELDERKRVILKTVINAYIRTGEPVGSKALAGMENREEMIRIAKTAAEKGLSVRDVERQVSKKASEPDVSASLEKEERKEPFYQEMELAMNAELGRRIRIRSSRSGGGTIEIAFFDQEDLRSLAYRLAGEESCR